MLVLAPLALSPLTLASPLFVAPPQEEEVVQLVTPIQGVDTAKRAAMAWLAAFQDADGKWDCDGFAKNTTSSGQKDVDPDVADQVFWNDDWLDNDPKPRRKAKRVVGWGAGAGDATHDIGVTGLALLALMADGNTHTEGPHAEQVGRALDWLRSVQDPDMGLFGEEVGHAFMYDHAIASLAIVKALEFQHTDKARESAQHALNYIARARNPYGVWRYDSPPIGDNDTSVTTWMVLAFEAAERAGLRVDRDSRDAALSWFDEMTEAGTGRVGYSQVGSRSSRVPGMNDHMSTDSIETLTAAALLCRLTLGQKPAQTPALIDHVRLIVRSIPDETPGRVDDALWVFYGTRATSWIGGRPWKEWSETYIPAVVGSQSKDGPGAGSWDPKNAWGFSMGRVGTTALMAWTLTSIDDR